MQLNRTAVKRKSQELVKVSAPKTLYAGLIILALGMLISFLSARMMGINVSDSDLLQYAKYIQDGNTEYALQVLESVQPPASAVIINIALQIISSVVSVGFVIFLMNVIRNSGACLGNLLDGFGIFFRILWLDILQSLFIFLWSMLFVVPGIIAAYRYRMAVYIMIDNPDMSAMNCIRESKKMMKNHKAELFMFDLSFFGWYLLASIPYLGYVVQVWTIPYINMSFALYYEALKNMPIDAQYSEIPGDSNNQVPPAQG